MAPGAARGGLRPRPAPSGGAAGLGLSGGRLRRRWRGPLHGRADTRRGHVVAPLQGLETSPPRLRHDQTRVRCRSPGVWGLSIRSWKGHHGLGRRGGCRFRGGECGQTADRHRHATRRAPPASQRRRALVVRILAVQFLLIGTGSRGRRRHRRGGRHPSGGRAGRAY